MWWNTTCDFNIIDKDKVIQCFGSTSNCHSNTSTQTFSLTLLDGEKHIFLEISPTKGNLKSYPHSV